MSMPIFMGRETLKIQPYREPKKGKPLNLFVHPSKTYDSLAIAMEGCMRTIVMRPNKFNVLEIVDPKDDIHYSYTGMHQANMAQTGNNGFIFDPSAISKIPYYHELFDNVHDVVISGGAAMRCHNWTFLSLLAIKSLANGNKCVNLFKGDRQFYDWACAMVGQGMRSLNILNSNEVNFHFNAESIYIDIKDVVLFDGKALEVARYNEYHDPKEAMKYPDWVSLFMDAPYFKSQVPATIAKGLPDYYRARLKTCDLNINEFLDGEKIDMPVSENCLSETTANLYFWSTTTKMAEHFARVLG
jgi:hypothetical protein